MAIDILATVLIGYLMTFKWHNRIEADRIDVWLEYSQ